MTQNGNPARQISGTFYKFLGDSTRPSVRPWVFCFAVVRFEGSQFCRTVLRPHPLYSNTKDVHSLKIEV